MMVKEFIGSCKNIFNFHGRARRREYWVTQLWLWSILLLDGILALVMQYIPEEGSEAAQIVWGIGMILAVCIFRLNSALFPEIQSTLFRYFRAGISA